MQPIDQPSERDHAGKPKAVPRLASASTQSPRTREGAAALRAASLVIVALASVASAASCRRTLEPRVEAAVPSASSAVDANATDATPAHETSTTAPTPTRVRVGLSGPRSGPEATCRRYELTYGARASHPSVDSERRSDVWWQLGLRAENWLEVRLREPSRFDHVEVGWYLLRGPHQEECATVLELEVNGAVVARVSPPPSCRTMQGHATYEQTSVVALGHAVEAQTLRWIDRTPTNARVGVRPERYVLVERLDLWLGAPVRRAVLAVVPSLELSITSGPAPGGWRWSLEHQGLFLVQPEQTWRPIGGMLGREHGERAFVHSDDERGFFAVAPADLVHAGPSTRHEVYMEPRTQDEPALVAIAPDAITDAWFDRCRRGLVVELRDHSRHLVFSDGTMRALPR